MVPAVVSSGLEAFGGFGFVASAGGDASGEGRADADAGGGMGGDADAGGDVDAGAASAAGPWEAAPKSSTELDFARRCAKVIS